MTLGTVISPLLLLPIIQLQGPRPEAEENARKHGREENGGVRDGYNRRDCVLHRGAGRRRVGRGVQEEKSCTRTG